ncbi:MAG: MoaD/ThiS family protein [Dehalococcoidia bacterium]
MKVTVRFFALYRQLVGTAETSVEVPAGATLSQLWEQVQGLFTGLRGYPLMAAVNGEQCDGTTPLSGGDEVAFLPPFSGGRR